MSLLLSLIDEMEQERKSRGRQRIDWLKIGVWIGCALFGVGFYFALLLLFELIVH